MCASKGFAFCSARMTLAAASVPNLRLLDKHRREPQRQHRAAGNLLGPGLLLPAQRYRVRQVPTAAGAAPLPPGHGPPPPRHVRAPAPSEGAVPRPPSGYGELPPPSRSAGARRCRGPPQGGSGRPRASPGRAPAAPWAAEGGAAARWQQARAEPRRWREARPEPGERRRGGGCRAAAGKPPRVLRGAAAALRHSRRRGAASHARGRAGARISPPQHRERLGAGRPDGTGPDREVRPRQVGGGEGSSAPRGGRPRRGRAGGARGWGAACGGSRGCGARRGLRSSGFTEPGEVSLRPDVRDLSHLRRGAPGSCCAPLRARSHFAAAGFQGLHPGKRPERCAALSPSESGRAAAGRCETNVTLLLKNVRRRFSPLRPGPLAHLSGALSLTCSGRPAALLALSCSCFRRRCPARAALRLRTRSRAAGPRGSGRPSCGSGSAASPLCPHLCASWAAASGLPRGLSARFRKLGGAVAAG